MAELRRSPVSGEWVVAGYSTAKSDSVGECPFCPGNEYLTTKTIREVKGPDGNWIVRCFSASNPVFVIEVAERKRAEGLYDKMGNVGAHEIIVENPSHTKTLSGFTESELSVVLQMYMDRILDLKKDKRFKYVQAFRNHGELAGSYIFHPHSHVLATPILPPGIGVELANTKMHYLQKERCLFCDILSQEIRQNVRIVSINASFVAICPFASRFPYEAWIVPRSHEASFESLRDERARDELIDIVLDLLKRVEKLTNAYTILIHTSPNPPKDGQDGNLQISDYFHWHIEILPRDLRSSKNKMDDEFHVTSVTPEEAVHSLKIQKV
jgi:UDPglucose--hexose-1-phosphate uridylyltransferase